MGRRERRQFVRGSVVMKGFPNDETGEDEDFIGVVVGMPSADLYHVVYEDGDGEDLTHAELSAVVTGTVDTAMADATGHDGTFDSDGDDDKGEPGPHHSPLTLTVGVAASCRLGVCPARGGDTAWR